MACGCGFYCSSSRTLIFVSFPLEVTVSIICRLRSKHTFWFKSYCIGLNNHNGHERIFMDDDGGLPGLDPPTEEKHLKSWSVWIAWNFGRYIRRISGCSTPREQASVVRAFTRGLEDNGEPLPGDRPSAGRAESSEDRT